MKTRTSTLITTLYIVSRNWFRCRENVKRLVKNFNPKRVVETLPNSTYTAYSENKGEHGGTGGKAHREEIRQRAAEELERIRDGEIVADEPETVKREMLVYDDI